MTGFGRGEAKDDTRSISIELKSVNHRYFDTYLKIPKVFSEFEDKLIKRMKKSLRRGRVEVFFSVKSSGKANVNIRYNDDLAKKYFSAFESMKNDLGVNGEISLEMLSRAPDVLSVEAVEQDKESLWATACIALEESITSLLAMRKEEGEALGADMLSRMESIEGKLALVKQEAKGLVENHKEKLLERLKELKEDVTYDEGRLMQELVIYVDKTDVSEEIVRAQSHLVQLRKLFNTSEAVGRKMDFLLQELNREINTIGSKCSASSISSEVIDIKVELEKIREQVQNIV